MEEVVGAGELIIISREQAQKSPSGQKNIGPQGLEAEAGSPLVLTVDIDKGRDPLGFSSAEGSWQFMGAAMGEGMRKKKKRVNLVIIIPFFGFSLINILLITAKNPGSPGKRSPCLL